MDYTELNLLKMPDVYGNTSCNPSFPASYVLKIECGKFHTFGSNRICQTTTASTYLVLKKNLPF